MQNEAPHDSAPFETIYENGYLTWPAIIARQSGAQAHILAYSGSGIAANAVLMPEQYAFSLPPDSTTQWDSLAWTPDVVVIELGTNDYACRAGWYEGCRAEVQHDSDIVNAYEDFVARLRDKYPAARTFLVNGPYWAFAGNSIRTWAKAVVARRRAAGDSTVTYFEIPGQVNSKGDKNGVLHPSLAGSRKIAAQLGPFIRQQMEW